MPRYSPPEQVFGTDITPQSDLYTLGCVLWEMIAGHPYIHIDTAADLPRFHLDPPSPEIAECCADVPRWLQRLIRRCLAREPAHRPQSVEEVRIELEGRVPPAGLASLSDPLRPLLAKPWAEPIQTIIGDLSRLRSPALGCLRLIDLCEVLIKLPAVLALDRLAAGGCELPQRPSLGHWVEALRARAAVVAGHLRHDALDLFQSMVPVRNRYKGHGALLGEHEYEEVLASSAGRYLSFLDGCDLYSRVRWENGTFLYDGHPLGSTHLLFRGECQVCLHPEAFFFNSSQANVRSYLSYETGHVQRRAD